MQLTESDITSETTDNQVSKKLIDKDGNIVMLIEAQIMDYYSNDDINATKGCFIKRFEFVKELVNHWRENLAIVFTSNIFVLQVS